MRISDWSSDVCSSDLSIQLGDVALTTSRDVLQDVAQGKGPAQLLITLGYAGWGAGQLESEMSQNAWLNVAVSNDILFKTPFEERYEVALGQLGIEPLMLTGDAGQDRKSAGKGERVSVREDLGGRRILKKKK